MRQSPVRFSGSVPYAHTRSLADFTITMSGFRFSVRTGLASLAPGRNRATLMREAADVDHGAGQGFGVFR